MDTPYLIEHLFASDQRHFWIALRTLSRCVHIHWRWGTGANYAPGRAATPRFTSGVPMVASAEQDVTVAVTTNGPETVDPVATGWRGLANLEPVAQRDLVFWYVGKSRADRDTFFSHGGFFADLQAGGGGPTG